MKNHPEINLIVRTLKRYISASLFIGRRKNLFQLLPVNLCEVQSLSDIIVIDKGITQRDFHNRVDDMGLL